MVYYGKDIYSPSFIHYGIKNQKWGVRRFQNKDGTLTEAGKRRYYGPGSGISANLDANNAVVAGGGGDSKDDLEKEKDKIDEMNLFEMKKELKRLEQTSPNSVLVNYLKTEMRKKENADLDTASRAAKAQETRNKEKVSAITSAVDRTATNVAVQTKQGMTVVKRTTGTTEKNNDIDTASRSVKSQSKKSSESVNETGKGAVNKILSSLTPKHNTTTTRVSLPMSAKQGDLSDKDWAKVLNSYIDKEKAAQSAPKGSAAYIKQKIKEQEALDAHKNAGKMSNKDLAKYYTWLLDQKKKK